LRYIHNFNVASIPGRHPVYESNLRGGRELENCILMTPLSVVVITFNEEKQIGRCIDSVLEIADEIVILDSYSGDSTVEIAASKGARVYSQEFLGYVEQKNKALQYASHNLVLSLDADEAIDSRLRTSIAAIKENTVHHGFTMNRCTNYCGKFIRHGLWYPDRKLRLFDKSLVKWSGDNPHDMIEFTTPKKNVLHLPGDILHFSYNSIEEHVIQNNRFSSISAESLAKRGRKSSWFNMIFNPWWAFFKGYFLRLGFLDGFYGFVIAVNVAHFTFLKHIKVYQKQKSKAPL